MDFPHPGLVTIIIPVFNRPEMLREAVASALAQTYRPIEIVIIDDGSTDRTPSVIADLAAAHAGVIRALRQENAGPGTARERGRLAARGEFIQYLDSDDLLLPRKLELQVQALRSAPRCGVAYGITHLVNAEGQSRRTPFKGTGRRFEFLFPDLLVDRWWNTHTPLWRREVCDRIGPWPAMRIGEDWVYDARAGSLRVSLAYVAEPVAETRTHDEARLTGGGATRAKLLDMASVMFELDRCSREAGCSREMPEVQHFVRHVFLMARQAGGAGESDIAWRLLSLARSLATPKDPKMQAVAWTARTLGWRMTSRLCGLAERLRGPQADAAREHGGSRA